MYRVSVEFTFCYAHRLPAHPGKCRHLHGHNGRAVVTLETPDLNDGGMVCDFGDIKGELNDLIAAHLDHVTILQDTDPLVAVLREHGQRVTVTDRPPTAEWIAWWVHDRAYFAGLPVAEVTFHETDRCSATYRAD